MSNLYSRRQWLSPVLGIVTFVDLLRVYFLRSQIVGYLPCSIHEVLQFVKIYYNDKYVFINNGKLPSL